ncbi:anthranilate synthase component I family protein [Robiginitalea sp. IMCC44478]|uniref:anthranilate synthase component I family protein n=1 Tax=Robiginitalea sp. IMCC44478 TaxID=3459122 RepID=UPI004041A98F
MDRISQAYAVEDLPGFKQKLLFWSAGYKVALWLDSNEHPDPLGRFEGMLAAGVKSELKSSAEGGFEKLSTYRLTCKDWIFGLLGYDLKNDLENLHSARPDRLEFPDLYFFQPLKMVELNHGKAIFHYCPEVAGEIEADFKAISEQETESATTNGHPPRIQMGIYKDEYLQKVNRLLSHIYRGDIYEINFCQEFYAQDARLNPYLLFSSLNQKSRAPFSAMFRLENKFVICASPERYLCRRAQELFSQPMKGTAPRDTDAKTDHILATRLAEDGKERAENIMIADLVRNDLSKNALRGSVKVQRLCEVKTYAQVHQMITTIMARTTPQQDSVELLRDSFPMGSMTGAPKIAAMQLIENNEAFRRGAYSGSIGYFSPQGDFDFNVVIRTILYDRARQVLSFAVGSAITARSLPMQEYQECLLKAKAMREVLEGA